MNLLQKICARLRHPFRQPVKTEIHLDSTFHRTRYYICRVCGEVVKEENDMTHIEEKALHFITALADVYRDKEKRELDVFSKLEMTDDFTEDITAMLVAMQIVVERLTDYESDLIDFTHMLNKLAVQHIMEVEGE